MSFILDALRKSEHARQRQTGPGLAEAPIAPTRPKANVWATAAIALLVVNLLAVGILLLRRAQKQDAAVPTPTAPVANTASGPANPTLVTPPPTAGTPVTQGAAPARAPMDEPAGPGGRNPLADEVGEAPDAIEASSRSAAAAVPAGPRAVVKNGGVQRGGSVVYAPVPEASDLPYSPPPEQPAVQQAAPQAATLPDADEVAARGGVAALHLDLHVYVTQPQQRFIFVNSRKYKEGDTLAEGPLVEEITPDGAVLNFRGSRFKLSND
ncbi:MAG: general secretion pathway protein GspB [Proteobacteria bacterium]|nr:general secretion pathway protein GspB [Pseudomonadota bacterium]